MSRWQCLWLLPFVTRALAALDLALGDDSDLTSFVTHPEIKVPKFNVSVHDQSRVTPGYWFVAPYAYIYQHTQAPKYYQACQTGPSIYDHNGDLVWAGACKVRNQNTFDFRPRVFNGTQYLSALHNSFSDVGDRFGHGIIMNASYDVVQSVRAPKTMPGLNMHELNIFDEGRRALYLLWEPIRLPLDDLHLATTDVGWVADMGFHEIDLTTGNILFEWWANRAKHVSLNESRVATHDLDGPWPKAWNWFHGNSIEKNSEGDYLLSSRYTDTIFKISGETGEVLWRLGGFRSSFEQKGFSIYGQHDARTQYIDDKIEIISFLNNLGDDDTKIANTSVAMVVQLDRSAMTAQIISEIPRPDGGLTRLRGNHQILPNGNHFVCWSENSYMTEHTPEGEMVMEAKFSGARFVTYRAYKFNYTANPNDFPTVVGHVHGSSPSKATTAIYVSWNGATEVTSWKLYDQRVDSSSKGIGHITKTGFETVFHADGVYTAIYAEALNKDGIVVGTSGTVSPSTPDSWITLLSTDMTESTESQKLAEGGHDAVCSHEDPLMQGIYVVGVYPWMLYAAGSVELIVCFALASVYFRPWRQSPSRYRRLARKESWI